MFKIDWSDWNALSIKRDRRSGYTFLWIERANAFALSPQVPLYLFEGTIGL